MCSIVFNSFKKYEQTCRSSILGNYLSSFASLQFNIVLFNLKNSFKPNL